MSDTDRARRTTRPWYRRPGAPFALLLVVLLLGFRLRSQIKKQANTAIAGQLTVGDVDLWLLSAAVALKNVVLRAENAAPDVPPLLEFQRLYAQLSYLSLLRHMVRIKDVALDGPAVHMEHTASGAVPLPGLRIEPAAGVPTTPTTTSAVSTVPVAEPAAEKPTGTPWNIVLDQVAVHGGRLSLRDHVPNPPMNSELSLGSLLFNDFTLLRSEEGVPGHGPIEAKFGDGAVRIDATVTTRAEGHAFEATVDVANVPLDRIQQARAGARVEHFHGAARCARHIARPAGRAAVRRRHGGAP